MGDGEEVEEFFTGKPATADNVAFDERNHGVAAANGKEPYFEESKEQCEIHGLCFCGAKVRFFRYFPTFLVILQAKEKVYGFCIGIGKVV